MRFRSRRAKSRSLGDEVTRITELISIDVQFVAGC